MNLERVEQIAKAVLYEGYMLYPYRPSSVKNQQRWNFGVVYPEAYSNAQEGTDPCSLRTECLVSGSLNTAFDLRLRFLQLQRRLRRADSDVSLSAGWQEAVERDISLPEAALEELCQRVLRRTFTFATQLQLDSELDSQGVAFAVEQRQERVEGAVDVSAEKLREDLFKVCVYVQNMSPMEMPAHRGAALMHSLVSTHAILRVNGGEFISLLEPPLDVQSAAHSCRNVGLWPVLVGEQGQRDTLLASPIILYDYPQIAPESAGDLFDGTEIDEILSLRIMTLTDEEKSEIRGADDRARQILERTESMPAEQFMKLHGALRGMRPLKEETS